MRKELRIATPEELIPEWKKRRFGSSEDREREVGTAEEIEWRIQTGGVAGKIFRKAQELDDEGRTQKALELARWALRLYKEAECYDSMGDVHVFLGEFGKAKECYEHESFRTWKYRHESGPYPDLKIFERKIKSLSRGVDKCDWTVLPYYKRALKRKNPQQIRLVAFDLDGTLTESETHVWAGLNERYGTADEAEELAQRYRQGKINYRMWAHEAFMLLINKGMDREGLEETLSSIKLIEGARETLSELKREGKKLALISGSLDLIVRRLFPESPFDEEHINQVSVEEDGSLSLRATPYGDGKYKAQALEKMAQEYGLQLAGCAYIGDNVNDLEVAKVAGLPIAFNPKSEEFKKVCDRVVEEDIRKILPYLLEWK